MRSSPNNNRLKQKLMKLSETEGESTKYRTFVKVSTPQILEPKFQMNLKTIRELKQKMNVQSNGKEYANQGRQNQLDRASAISTYSV